MAKGKKMTACPVCNAEKVFQILFETKSILFEETFTIGECPSCGLQRVLNIPDNIDKYYQDTQMKKKLTAIHSSMKEILLKRELSRLLKFSDGNSLFLDIGCGVGDFTNLIYKHERKVVAIDASSQRPVNIASKEEIPYCTIDYNSYTINKLPRMSNGTVILRHVLEHTRNPSEFIRSLISYGAKSFYIVVPNHCCMEAKIWGQYYYFLDPPLHLSFFNNRTLKLLLNNCQLKVVDSGYDTIPNLVSSLYRYLSLKGFPKEICRFLRPQSALNSLSAPLNILFPRNVIWVFVKLM